MGLMVLMRYEALHDALRIPQDGIGVEVLGRVEPQIELLLPVTLSLCVHIGVDNIRIPTKVTKEFKINLIPCRSLRFKLQHKNSILVTYTHTHKISRTKLNHLLEFRKSALGTYIICSHSTSRVARDELKLHINLCKEIVSLGLEARARSLVKRQSK